MITLIKSPLKNSANNIVASPQTRMVKALDFDKKSEYKKFIKWIDSSTKDLEKIKIPSKKEIKKLEKLVLEMDRGGGGLGGLLGLLGGIPGMFLPGLGGPDIPFIRRPKPPRGKPKPNSSKGGGPKIPRLNPKQLGRMNDSFSRYIAGKSNLGDRFRLFKGGRIGLPGLFTKGGFNAQGALKGQGFKLPGFGGGQTATGGAPKLGGGSTKMGGALKNAGGFARRASGPASLLFAGLDYQDRKTEGQTETQAISGATSSAVGGAVAGSLATAIALTVIPEPSTTVAGLIMLGSLAASYFGGKAAGSLSDKITGANKTIDANKKITEEKQKSENQFSSVLKTFNEAVDGLLTFAQSGKKVVDGDTDDNIPLNQRLYGTPKEGGGYEYTDPDTNITLTPSGSYGQLRGDRIHKGEDIATTVGTPLRAISDGEIVDSDYEKGWGNFLVFRDDRGTHHLYGHMQEGYKRGGPVKKGDIIGKVGLTGRTDGPHLHWETGTGWNGGQITGRFDPMSAYKISDPFFTSKSKPGEEPSRPLSAPSVPRVQPTPEARSRVEVPMTRSGGGQTVIITQGQGGGPQVIPQQIPIPIPMGGGGGGVAVASIPEVVLLNSLWNTLLLTKLSST